MPDSCGLFGVLLGFLVCFCSVCVCVFFNDDFIIIFIINFIS